MASEQNNVVTVTARNNLLPACTGPAPARDGAPPCHPRGHPPPCLPRSSGPSMPYPCQGAHAMTGADSTRHPSIPRGDLSASGSARSAPLAFQTSFKQAAHFKGRYLLMQWRVHISGATAGDVGRDDIADARGARSCRGTLVAYIYWLLVNCNMCISGAVCFCAAME